MVLFSHGWLWVGSLGFGLEFGGVWDQDGLRDMARAGAGELVGVNEESPVGVAGVDREHPVVHELLGAL